MEGKGQILAGLTAIYTSWQTLLARLNQEQLVAPVLPGSWSVKDKLAHLWSWQQVSVARMQAALEDGEPDYPEWWHIFAPDPEADVDRTNSWLFAASHAKPWSQVHRDWATQFERYLELTRAVPEEDLLTLGRFSWMGGYALSASALGSLEHHVEHYEDLSTWLASHGYLAPAG